MNGIEFNEQLKKSSRVKILKNTYRICFTKLSYAYVFITQSSNHPLIQSSMRQQRKSSQFHKHLFRCCIYIACLCLFDAGAFAQKLEVDSFTKSLKNLASRQIERPTDYDLAKDWDLFQFKLKKIRHLLQFYRSSQEMTDAVAIEVKQAEELLGSLEAKTQSQPRAGIAEEAYFDNVDGSPQPFIRYLPENYDKKNNYPLLVYLHGYSPYMDIVNWGLLPEGLKELADKVNACIVMPFARGNTDFQGIGEQDVLNVIRQMGKRYNIDEDRIILVGMSMGGMGAWTIGAHYPHLFAGLLVISGRGDFYFWHKIKRNSMPAYRQWLIDKEFAAAHIPNFSRLPVWSFHGTADTLIPIDEARRMNELLSPNNPLFKYQEIVDGDHWLHEQVFSNKDVIDWIKNIRRKNPESFEYIAYHPAYHQAYWIDISDFAENCQPAKLQVEVKDKEVLIRASGVRELVLDRNKMPERIRKFPVIKQNEFILKESQDSKSGGNAYVSGPVKDAFLEPFIFVNAGLKDSEMRQRSLEWYKFSKSLPRVKNEKELTEYDKKSFNLFLYGEPESSPLIEEVLKQTPIKITGDEILIGDKKYPRKGNGIYLKYKSSWAPAKSVVIQCGIPWGKTCPENHIYDSLPGYIVYSGEADPGDPFGGNKALAGGFFDKYGKLIP
jgi:pimeloyl-ACP methyl ester carboxylesterase